MNPFYSVRFRLFSLCVGLLLVLGGANAMLGTIIQRFEARQSTQQEQFRRVEAINEAQRALSRYRNAQGAVNTAILVGNADIEVDARRRFGEEERLLNESLEVIAKFAQEYVVRIREALSAVPAPMAKSIQAFLQRDTERSQQLYEQVSKHLRSVEDALNAVTAREVELAQQIQLSAQRHADRARSIALWIILLSAAAGLVLTWAILRSIIRPLQKTVIAIRKVNAGETELDLPPVQEDEFGDMAVALRQFRDHAEQLRDLAYRDSLTGLGNRTYLEGALRNDIDARAEDGRHAAILYIDLDNFRDINDSLGHSSGDQYLCEAALRLQRFAPMGAEVCRYSGDKFTVLLDDVPDENHLGAIKSVAETIQRGLNEPFHLAGNVLPMSVSIGISVFPADGTSSEALVSAADAAMYRAKKRGRNNVQFADPELTAGARRKLEMATDIRRGLDTGEFEPYYQPIVDASTGAVVSAEALLRWRHPLRGLVPAADFIPVAEATGLIHSLGEYCLKRACDQSLNWAMDHRDIRVSVNLSARQIEDGSVIRLLEEIHADGRGKASLDFEITETVMLDHIEHSREILSQVKQKGHRLGVDDFGTGYSSMVYLQRFPVDRIKIDRSFVARVESSREALAIISATLALAKSLDLEVIAEGVESESQVQRLRELGCSLHQGYFYTAALPSDEFESWVDARRKAN